ncbi:MAG: chemotaxis protein CheA, partial [Ferrovum sp.]|nr:chemotaxis protein CheA [Ferrovum sp.]
MNDFAGMEELLQDFLQESSDLLSDVESKLLNLERSPNDINLLNDIFRGFHTIKGGAGFLNAHELVSLCHLTENLFDRLRNADLQLNAEIMDAILAATNEIRHMFNALARGVQPAAAPSELVTTLRAVTPPAREPEIDEARLRTSFYGRRATDIPGSSAPPTGRRDTESARENNIRVDTELLDQVINLSREIGLTRNRLNQLRTEILLGTTAPGTLRALDEAVNQLDMLVVSLQNSVMKTRMQPIGRLFKRFPRLVRDLARQLGKEVELVLAGEDAEIDKTMIEDLNDPLVHLIRNAVDHGVEVPQQRQAAGKTTKSLIQLRAHRADHNL